MKRLEPSEARYLEQFQQSLRPYRQEQAKKRLDEAYPNPPLEGLINSLMDYYSEPQNIANTILDFIPGVGDVKSAQEAIMGRSLVNQEPLNWWERGLSAVGALPLVPSIVGMTKLRKFDKMVSMAKEEKAFEVGKEWDKTIPIKTVGFRYGRAPEGGKSYNSMTNMYEEGTSLASASGLPEVKSFAVMGAASKRKKFHYEGDLIGYGGDDEPIMANIREISAKEYLEKVNSREVKEAALSLALDQLKTAEILKARGYQGFDKEVIERSQIVGKLRKELESLPEKEIK